MGVTAVGDRKSLLDAVYDVHKKTWQSTSLPSIAYNRALR